VSDLDDAIALVRGGKLTTDQLLRLHHDGQLRPAPGQGVRVLVIGSLPGYQDELAAFHSELSHELVKRGVASYA
jgi:hypothetical protein